MDPRGEMLKSLKKAYKQKKRKCVCVWKTLGILSFILALCAAGGMLLPRPFLLDISMLFGKPAVLVITVPKSLLLPVTAAVCTVLFLLFVIFWSRGRKKLKKSRQYLDYRTMRNTLKAEKKP